MDFINHSLNYEMEGGVINMIEGLLLRLLIGALVYWIGEKVIGLIKNAELVNILNIILIIAIVLYVIFGSILPIK
jgi:hypothetical protein